MQNWEDVRIWRKEQRERLIARRLLITRDERQTWSAAITAQLEQVSLVVEPPGIVGFYWPFKGEYDPRVLARSLHSGGAHLALPVVTERARPLSFREWWPGMRMKAGVWDIPVPDEGDWVQPKVLLVPVLGFDPQGYRLGYGGGYYDRTLAASRERPLAIGIGFTSARLLSIHPQPHDVPMNLIVTERGLLKRRPIISRAAGQLLPQA